MFRLTLRDVGDGEAAVTVPAGWAAFDLPAAPGARRWDVVVPAERSVHTFSVAVTSAASARGPLPVPTLGISFGPPTQAVLAQRLEVDLDRLNLSEADGLTRVGPAEWRVTDSSWRARVVRLAGPPTGEGARRARAEVTVTRAGRTWLYRGRFQVAANEADPVRVVPPPGADLRSLSVDGVSVPVGDPTNVELPAAVGGQQITVLWASVAPVWEAARLVGPSGPLGTGGIDWTVRVPVGYRLEGAGEAAGGQVAGSSENLPTPFDRGSPWRFHVPAGQSLDARLVPVTPPARSRSLALAVVVGIIVLGLALLWPRHTRPEQAAGLCAIVVVAVGPAAGVLLMVPAAVMLWRLWRMAHWLFARKRPGLPAAATP
jgi:hypothetical protein